MGEVRAILGSWFRVLSGPDWSVAERGQRQPPSGAGPGQGWGAAVAGGPGQPGSTCRDGNVAPHHESHEHHGSYVWGEIGFSGLP